MIFPVVFAYGEIYIEPRLMFVLNLTMILAGITTAACLGILLGQSVTLKTTIRKGMVILTACVTALILVRAWQVGAPLPVSFSIYKNIVNGNMRLYNEDCQELYQTLEESAGEDVIISELPDDMGILHPLRLQADPEHWINAGMARWYGCKSITVE